MRDPSSLDKSSQKTETDQSVNQTRKLEQSPAAAKTTYEASKQGPCFGQSKKAETQEQASLLEIIPYLIPCFMLFIGLYAEYKYANVVFLLWLFYALTPLLDYMLPLDNYNLPSHLIRTYQKDQRFLFPLYMTFTFDLFAYVYMMWLVSTDHIQGSCLQFPLYALVFAHSGAVNAVVGHELLHRRETVHKIFGTLAYSKMLYSHFFIEHVKGHHKLVATPEDPSTAHMNESLYHFFTRVPGGYTQVWNYEKNRLAKDGISAFSIYNRLLSFNVAHVLYLCLIGQIFNMKTVYFHLLYSFFCVMMLETINYIEHYGLQRKKDKNGVYQSINITHSWNAPHTFTNYMLFKLQRHSDHHANSYKPYQILNSLEESPMLPHGYSVCLILSFIPTVWFKVCNPIANAVNTNQKVSFEMQKELERWMFGTLFVIFCVMTYICFFLVGFNLEK